MRTSMQAYLRRLAGERRVSWQPDNKQSVTASTDHSGFSVKIRIYYEDTDVGGVVYYANYLKYMERARTEYLRSLGYDQSDLLIRLRRQFVVRRAAIEYVSPARFDDVLVVDAKITKARGASLEFSQSCTLAHSEADAKGSDAAPSGRLVASGQIMIVCLDADSHKPRAIPEELKMSLHR